jgi:hypothetical protein
MPPFFDPWGVNGKVAGNSGISASFSYLRRLPNALLDLRQQAPFALFVTYLENLFGRRVLSELFSTLV